MTACLDLRTLEPRVLADDRWTSLVLLDEVESTNTELARQGVPGAVVMAHRQSAGKGRLGRSWQAPEGGSLIVSAMVPTPPRDLGWMPLLAGLAAVQAIKDVAGLTTAVKWPNDVVQIGGQERKVAGILCELVPAGLIVGIGINVNLEPSELPVSTATSVSVLAGRRVCRAALVAAYLRHLADATSAINETSDRALDALKTTYRRSCSTLDRQVRIHNSDLEEVVYATGIGSDGTLMVTNATGSRGVAAGDVHHVRPI